MKKCIQIKIQKQILKFFFLLSIFLMLPQFAHATDPDPTTEPLLQPYNLVYEGAFMVPHDALAGTQTSFYDGGGPLTYNPAGNGGAGSLIAGVQDYVNYVDKWVDISIPTPVKSSNLGALNTATLLQAPFDPTGGNWNNTGAGGTSYSNGSFDAGIYTTMDS